MMVKALQQQLMAALALRAAGFKPRRRVDSNT